MNPSPLPRFASAFLLDSERKIEATVYRPPSFRLETGRACAENEHLFQHCPIQQTAFHRLSVATQAAYRRRTQADKEASPAHEPTFPASRWPRTTDCYQLGRSEFPRKSSVSLETKMSEAILPEYSCASVSSEKPAAFANLCA